MIYLIIAQIARIGVVWTANRMYRQVLKTIALAAVGFYLAERVKKQNRIDEHRGIRTDK